MIRNILERLFLYSPKWMQKTLSFVHKLERNVVYYLSWFLWKDYPYNCPVCGKRVKRFHPLPDFHWARKEKYGNPYRFEDSETLYLLNYSCPHCGISDRERLYAIYLRERIGCDNHSVVRFLDIAPSKSLTRFIRRLPNVRYRSADFNQSKAMDMVDITLMDIYSDESFDVFLCSHVLEHVPNDKKAISELYRVLAPGGWGILMVPLNLAIKTTDEDPMLENIAERIRRFGQEGHVRAYSKRDFIERVEAAGFFVNQLGIKYFGDKIFHRCGIADSSVLYVVEKSTD